jgi:hypothetical protein
MMAAVARSRPQPAPSRAQALMIGLIAAHTPLLNLFATSHWTLQREPDLIAALERLSREHFPAVFCQAAEWKRIAPAMASLDRPPVVIALAESRATDEWMQAIASHVYLLDAKHLAAPELFSLLNHAWRVSNKTGV